MISIIIVRADGNRTKRDSEHRETYRTRCGGCMLQYHLTSKEKNAEEGDAKRLRICTNK